MPYKTMACYATSRETSYDEGLEHIKQSKFSRRKTVRILANNVDVFADSPSPDFLNNNFESSDSLRGNLKGGATLSIERSPSSQTTPSRRLAPTPTRRTSSSTSRSIAYYTTELSRNSLSKDVLDNLPSSIPSAASKTNTLPSPSFSSADSSALRNTSSPTTSSAVPNAGPVSLNLPGRQLQVLPIGLGVFGAVSLITLIVVGVVTYQRKQFREQFRFRKLAELESQKRDEVRIAMRES